MLFNYCPSRVKGRQRDFLNHNPICVCLGVNYFDGKMTIGVLNEVSTPIKMDIEFFDPIDTRIPNNWVIDYDQSGIFIGPREFTSDFWTYFYDGDTLDPVRGYEAQELFKEVVNKIYAFHGLPPHFVEEKEPEPLKEHEWWKEYLDEDER